MEGGIGAPVRSPGAAVQVNAPDGATMTRRDTLRQCHADTAPGRVPCRRIRRHIASAGIVPGAGRERRRRVGVSLRYAPGRAARAVGNDTAVANRAGPPPRRPSGRSLGRPSGAAPSRPSGRASLTHRGVYERTRQSRLAHGDLGVRARHLDTGAEPRPRRRAARRTDLRSLGIRPAARKNVKARWRGLMYDRRLRSGFLQTTATGPACRFCRRAGCSADRW
jgi:hypothetical protein